MLNITKFGINVNRIGKRSKVIFTLIRDALQNPFRSLLRDRGKDKPDPLVAAEFDLASGLTADGYGETIRNPRYSCTIPAANRWDERQLETMSRELLNDISPNNRTGNLPHEKQWSRRWIPVRPGWKPEQEQPPGLRLVTQELNQFSAAWSEVISDWKEGFKKPFGWYVLHGDRSSSGTECAPGNTDRRSITHQ